MDIARSSVSAEGCRQQFVSDSEGGDLVRSRSAFLGQLEQLVYSFEATENACLQLWLAHEILYSRVAT